MSLRAFLNRLSGGRSDNDTRVAYAAHHAVESLEQRQLLSVTPSQIQYAWNHMAPALRRQLAIYEYFHPQFAANLNAQLEKYDLAPVTPQQGNPSQFNTSARHAKHRRISRLPKRIPSHPSKRGGLLRSDQFTGPLVAGTTFDIRYLPNQINFTFDSAVSSSDWNSAVTVINLNTGAPVLVSATYNASQATLTVSLNGGAILADANYTAILHGGQITRVSDGTHLIGSDGIAGHDYQYNFFFLDGDFDQSRVIDLSDYTTMVRDYGTASPNYTTGDINYDGAIDLTDYVMVVRRFGLSEMVVASPGAPAASNTTSSSITLSWTPPQDTSNVTYDVYRDSARIASGISGTSMTDSSLQAGTSHTYFIIARDQSSNSSYPSQELVAATAPQIATAPVYYYDALPQTLTYAFSEPISSGNWNAALTVVNLNTGAMIPASGSYNATTNTLTYSLNTGSIPPNGNYTAFLHGSMIQNASGVKLAGDSGAAGSDLTYSFYFLDGDFNRDRVVDSNDSTIVSANLGTAGHFSQGDFNYSGAIDSTDANATSAAIGTSLPNLGTPGPATLQRVDSSSVTLTWTNASDSRVTSFDVYRNFQRIATNQTSLTYADSGLASNTTYTYFVVSKDASGDTSTASQELVQTTNPPVPQTPLTPVLVQSTADSVLISWTDSDPAVIAYNVLRDGAIVGNQVAANAYLDSGLMAGTGYVYTVEAVTAGGVSAASASLSVTTDASPPAGYDTAVPATPTGVTAVDTSGTSSESILVSWTPISGAGITYEVDRNGVELGVTTGVSLTDSTVVSSQAYTYTVTAIDSAFNRSAPSTSTSAVSPGDKVAPNTPIDMQVTQDTGSSVTLSWVAPSDDANVTQYAITRTSGYTSSSFVATGTTYQDTTVTAGQSYSYIVQAVDAAGHTSSGSAYVIAYTPALISTTIDSSPNQYIPSDWQDFLYRPTDGLIAVLRQKMANVGAGPSPVGNWFDSSDHVFAGSPPSTGATLVHGTQGAYAYYDIANTGQWSTSDPIWAVPSGSSNAYQPGETIVFTPTGWTGTIPTGTIGRTNGMMVGAGAGGAQFAWAESSSFRTDLVSVYADVQSLIPYYAPAGSAVPYSVGTFLQALGLPTVAGTGVVQQVTVEGSYPNYFTALTLDSATNAIVGDQILISGKGYSVIGASGTQVILGGSNSSIPTSVGYSLVNWTKVPAITDSQTGLTLAYQRGIPDANGVIFPKHLSELHDALNALTDRPYAYGIWRLDTSTSATLIQTASSILGTYASVYGDTKMRATTLYYDIEHGMADPGAVFQLQLIAAMRNAVVTSGDGQNTVPSTIGGAVYVRGSGTNGWAVSNGSMYTYSSNAGFQTLFPSSGTWLSPNSNNAIDPAIVTQIQQVLDAIKANGLWIYSGQSPTVNYTTSDTTVAGSGTNQSANAHSAPSSWDVIDPSRWGSAAPTVSGPGYIQFTFDQYTDQPIQNPAPGDFRYGAQGVTATVTLGPGVNIRGGSAMTSLSPGSAPAKDGEAGWSWGTTSTIFSVSEQTVLAQLSSDYSTLLSHNSTTGSGSYTMPYDTNTGLPQLIGGGGSISWNNSPTDGNTWGGATTAHLSIPAVDSLYGKASDDGSFPPYTPSTPTPPSQPTVGAPPTDLVLTTPMDYLNTTPDTNLDGIVQVPADLSTFGNDTGVIAFQADRDAAQSYLPIFTDATGTLPLHGYFEQGAFSSTGTDGLPLLTNENVYSTSDPNGLPYGYSLSTFVRTNILIDDGVNHVKRMEVIRPGGNAVVFDFPWTTTTNSFSPIGTPLSWNNRDAKRTYVLRDLNPQNIAGSNYALEFASGIVQTFGGGLTSVSNAQGLTQFISKYSKPPTSDTYDSPRYNVIFNWANGRIDSVDYQTKTPTGVTAATIHTAITYTANQITQLSKNVVGGSAIPEFSYSLSGNQITRDGVSTTRSGTFTNSGTVTIFQSAADASLVGSYSEAFKFNANQMLMSDAVTLNEGDGQSDTEATGYAYGRGPRSLVNGYAPWGEVTRITYPDHSWVFYIYQDGSVTDYGAADASSAVNTGWLMERITPFKNGNVQAGDWNNVATFYSYDASLSGNGQGADPMNLVEQPRRVVTSELGFATGTTYIRVGGTTGTPVVGTENALSLLTRTAPTADSLWADSVFQTATTIAAYNAGTVVGPSGKSQTTASWNGSAMIYKNMETWMGTTLASTESDVNAFGGQLKGTDAALGSAYQSSTDSSPDAYGNYLSESGSGGITSAVKYVDPTTNVRSWFGPSSVTETDGSKTNYQYNPMGEVSVKTIFAGTSHSVQYSYKYDLAGHVTSLTTTPVDASGAALASPVAVTNTYDYDGMGRLVKEIDNSAGTDATANRTTTYSYASSVYTGTTTSILYPNGETETIVTNVDGTRASVTGTATPPATYDEGVVSLGGIPVSDVNGSPAGGHDALLVPGSAWSSVKSNGSANLTRTVFNFLGQPYLTQQSAPNPGNAFPQPMADAVTTFDGDGRPTKFVGYDGTASYTTYDPTTGQPASTFVDVNGDGVFTPGKDILSRSTFTPATTLQTAAAGSTSTYLSNKGVQTSVSTTTLSSGITQSSNTNGLTTTSVTTVPSGGAWTTTTTNPDGTKVVDTYADGLLVREDVLPTSGSTPTTWTSYVYDGMRRLITSHDFTGDTTYTYFEDGTQQSVQTPGHAAQSVGGLDKTNNAVTSTTRSDTGTISTPQNSLGNTSSVSGAGVLPTTFNYDSAGTGQLTNLTTYQSNTLNGSGAATTTWAYDQSTGLLKSKTYADGTSDTYTYNRKGQLSGISKPGITGSSFQYNPAGQLTSSSLTDSTNGTVSSTMQPDDLGRPAISSGTDNGKSYTNIVSYNANGQLDQIWFDIAGSGLSYVYYPATGFGTTGSPLALHTTTLNLPGNQAPQTTSYTYDPSSKRVQTITENGITFTIAYQDGSNQVKTVIATPSGGSTNVTIRFTQDTSNPARISQQVVSSNGGVLTETVSGYNQQDQINGQTISRKNSDGSTQSDTVGYGYNANNADALTSVTDTVGGTATTTTYAFDGAGNLTSTQVGTAAATSLGTPNSVNQFSGLAYGVRGNVIGDSTYTYAFDATNRLAMVTPLNTANYRLKYGYDSSGRRLWKDVYSYISNTWTLAYRRHYLWDGNNMVGELDENNNLLVGYTWGPFGLLAVTDYTASGGPRTYAVVSDLSGNVIQLIDPITNAIVADYHYDAYGNQLSANGPAADINGFRGKGLYYDDEAPDIGHALLRDTRNNVWLERDPAGELQGGANLTGTYKGDPINRSDTNGLDPTSNYDPERYVLTPKQLDPNYNPVALAPSISTPAAGAYRRLPVDSYLGQTPMMEAGGSLLSSIAAPFKEIGLRAVDFGNDYLYLSSGGTLGKSNLHLSQVSKLQASGQTTVGRATLASIPIAGNAYKLIKGKDALTNQPLRGWVDYTSTSFGLASDLSFAGAMGMTLGGVDVNLGGTTSFPSLSSASINDPIFSNNPAVQAGYSNGDAAAAARGYANVVEVRLLPDEFQLSDAQHFDIANEAVQDALNKSPDLAASYRAQLGDDFVDSLLRGEQPEGWTWHHALRSQANGEAGWLHLVDRDLHSSFWNSDIFHPNGYGGYFEWAVSKDAPYPR